MHNEGNAPFDPFQFITAAFKGFIVIQNGAVFFNIDLDRAFEDAVFYIKEHASDCIGNKFKFYVGFRHCLDYCDSPNDFAIYAFISTMNDIVGYDVDESDSVCCLLRLEDIHTLYEQYRYNVDKSLAPFESRLRDIFGCHYQEFHALRCRNNM